MLCVNIGLNIAKSDFTEFLTKPRGKNTTKPDFSAGSVVSKWA